MGLELLALGMLFAVIAVLMLGYPVAFTLAGTALGFAGIGWLLGAFDWGFMGSLPSRMFGVMMNETLIAVPLFVFMGVMLEKARIAEDLLDSMASLFGTLRGGLAFAVVAVGTLLAASTGIVGATVVTMGLLSLPVMLRRGYDPALSAGTIMASGTLGQIIPPSIVLVLLGDVLSSAYQQAQLKQGIYTPKTVSVGDLFAGALIPGLLLVTLYLAYLVWRTYRTPAALPRGNPEGRSTAELLQRALKALVPPLTLIVAVLGSIIGGVATPTEAASFGGVGALLLALAHRQLTLERLQQVMRSTTRITAMVFLILLGASLFSLTFRGLGGDDLVHELLAGLPGGKHGALLFVMVTMFLLGFVLDFIEITFVVVPIVGPVLLALGVDPIWLGVMMGINLQTSFLTPPFGFALFYLRGVAPPQVTTAHLYRGVVPFIALQMIALTLVWSFPWLATWLPNWLYGAH
jgi:tripartite ATP-independent transporter DctM subunit